MVFTYRDAYELEETVKPFLREVALEIDEFAHKHNFFEPTEEMVKKLDSELFEISKERFEGGKKVRPALIFAAAKAVHSSSLFRRFLDKIFKLFFKKTYFEKRVKSKLLPYAVRREMKHNGYLEIDDVQDCSPLRRGKPSTWVKIGKPRAINSGLLLSDAYARISEVLSFRKPYKLSSKARRIVTEIDGLIALETIEGQDLDIKYRASPELTPQISELIYRKKTGVYTIGGPMAIGAAIAGFEKELCMELYMLGKMYFGPAFQVIDDYLNLLPPEKIPKYGKEWADDLEEGKPTMMIALFNERATEKDKAEFYKYFGKRGLSKDEKMKLINLLDKYNAREDARKYAYQILREGLNRLEKIIPRKYSKELYALLEFTVKRTY